MFNERAAFTAAMIGFTSRWLSVHRWLSSAASCFSVLASAPKKEFRGSCSESLLEGLSSLKPTTSEEGCGYFSNNSVATRSCIGASKVVAAVTLSLLAESK